MDDLVLCAVDAGVATLTLNRPDRLNAANRALIRRLIERLDETDADDDVRAVVITGAGRAFCAGADLAGGDGAFDFSGRTDGGPAAPDLGGAFTLRAYRSLKPLIAAINGPAVGFGASMTLPMDIRVAADAAKFGFAFAARGIVPDGAASWFLPRIVGVPTALEWCLTGRTFLADEAARHGLVHQVVPADRVLATAQDLARTVAANVAPVSAALTRRMIWTLSGAEHPMAAHRVESPAIDFTGRSADAREGVRSFMEKRSPRWSGRVSQDMPPWYPWHDEPPYVSADDVAYPHSE